MTGQPTYLRFASTGRDPPVRKKLALLVRELNDDILRNPYADPAACLRLCDAVKSKTVESPRGDQVGITCIASTRKNSLDATQSFQTNRSVISR